MNTQQTSTQEKGYFDLHTHGIGYLSRIREVLPKKGKKGNPFWACQIAALVGERETPDYRYFDVSVVNEEAEKLIKRCQQAVEADKKVLISFVIADLWIDTFIYKTNTQYHKAGDTGVSLKGRLIRIKSVRIDGELKYQEKAKATEQVAEQTAQAA